jgi:predicted aspartyl protease
MKNKLICLFVVLIAGLFAPGMTPGNVEKSNNEMVIPFELKGHIILVKCKINDSKETYDFVVDTGGRTFIDKTLANELQLKQVGPQAKINTLSIGGNAFENVFVFTQFDFKQIMRTFGIVINGMIGSDFLDDYTVIIDYRNKRLILSRDTESLAGEKTEGGKEYFFKFAKHPINNSPLIKCKLDGEIETEAMIDTGQPFALVLPLSFLDKTGALKQKDTLKAKGVIVRWPSTKLPDNYLSRITSLEADRLRMNNLVTLYAELPAMLSVALLGKDFLSQFLVKINYPRNEILLLPEPAGKANDNLFSAGLSIELDAENNIVVRGVWEKSSADRAHIEVGDRILEFNSKKLTLESIQEFNHLLQDEKVEDIEVVVKNDKGQRKILLKKENLFKSNPPVLPSVNEF